MRPTKIPFTASLSLKEICITNTEKCALSHSRNCDLIPHQQCGINPINSGMRLHYACIYVMLVIISAEQFIEAEHG